MQAPEKVPSFFQVVVAIGRVTFFEVIRDKVLYNVFLCSFLILGLQWLASKLTALHPERVVLDFGLSAVTFSGVFMGLLIGAGMLGREMKNRTFHVAFCRPITRTQFIVGKFAGLSAVLILNWFILSSIYLLMLSYSAIDSSTSLFSVTLFVAIGFSLIQSLLMAAWSVLFSTISTASISVILGVGIYLIGSNVSQLRLVAAKVESLAGQKLIYAVATLLPNFEFFQLGTKVTYGLALSPTFLLQSILYGGVMMFLILWLSGKLLQIRED